MGVPTWYPWDQTSTVCFLKGKKRKKGELHFLADELASEAQSNAERLADGNECERGTD